MDDRTCPEQWRPVVGHPRYLISDHGRVWSVRAGRCLRPAHRQGYRTVQLGGITCPVQWLVLDAFVGPRPHRHQACHGNGDRADNRLANLRWATASENKRDHLWHLAQRRAGVPLTQRPGT